MRSTQIRTADRTLVTLPNGKLADMRIEDLAARDRLRFATDARARLRHERGAAAAGASPTSQALLRAHPKVWPETVVASFVGFGASVARRRRAVLVRDSGLRGVPLRRARRSCSAIMRVVREAGTSLALPTQTLHVKGGTPD